MRYLVAVLLLAAVACSDSTGPAPTVAGTYKLTGLNGQTLPVLVWSDARVVSGRMELRGDGTYTETIAIKQGTLNYQQIEEGTYTASETVVSFLIDYGVRYTGTVVNGSLVSTDGQ